MTDKVLSILRRHGKQIHCLIDGDVINNLSSSQIKLLMEQIEEIGSVRKNLAIFDYQLKPEKYDLYINSGISPMIVPSDKDVYLALECLDVVNNQQTDILCVGVSDESMLSIIVKAREKSEILLIGQTKENVTNYMPYIDYLITIKDIEKSTT